LRKIQETIFALEFLLLTSLMEFGRVQESQLNRIDFSLKNDPAFNAGILPGKPNDHAKVYLGCAMWGVPGWIGKIYPPGTKEKDYLKYYTRHFNCIELNATHYKIYERSTIEQWIEKTVGDDFLYCPKIFQGITHKGSLLDKQSLLNEFINSLQYFGKHLGPVFIQMSDFFPPSRRKELIEFLSRLPKEFRFYLELRQEDWFKDESFFGDFVSSVAKLGIGMVITDVAGRRDCSHMYLSLPSVFVRYVGNGLHPSDYTRLDSWAERAKNWLDSGLKEFYFLVHTHDEITAPEISIDFIDKLQDRTGLQLKKPKLIEGLGRQQQLFG